MNNSVLSRVSACFVGLQTWWLPSTVWPLLATVVPLPSTVASLLSPVESLLAPALPLPSTVALLLSSVMRWPSPVWAVKQCLLINLYEKPGVPVGEKLWVYMWGGGNMYVRGDYHGYRIGKCNSFFEIAKFWLIIGLPAAKLKLPNTPQRIDTSIPNLNSALHPRNKCEKHDDQISEKRWWKHWFFRLSFRKWN